MMQRSHAVNEEVIHHVTTFKPVFAEEKDAQEHRLQPRVLGRHGLPV